MRFHRERIGRGTQDRVKKQDVRGILGVMSSRVLMTKKQMLQEASICVLHVEIAFRHDEIYQLGVNFRKSKSPIVPVGLFDTARRFVIPIDDIRDFCFHDNSGKLPARVRKWFGPCRSHPLEPRARYRNGLFLFPRRWLLR